MNSPQKIGTAIEQMSANVLNTRFENFDSATVELAKNRIIDVIGCAIGGSNAPGNAALIKLVRKWGGNAITANTKLVEPETPTEGHNNRA